MLNRALVLILTLALALGCAAGMADAAPAHAGQSASFSVVAANVRSFPTMHPAQYRADIGRLFATDAAAIMGAEIHEPAGELATWKRNAAATGRRVVRPYLETTQALSPRLRPIGDRAFFLHDAPGGPASPPRWAVVTRVTVNGFRVAFVSLHLTNGCFPHKRGWRWYAARCAAVRAEIARVRAKVASLHERRFTVIVGGDLNHGPVTWGRRQISLGDAGVMHNAAVPASDVSVHVLRRSLIRTRATGGPLNTDHSALLARLTLTRR